MKKGWLLYDAPGLQRNEYFAHQLKEYASVQGFSLKTVLMEQVIYGTDSFGAFIAGERPDFVISRTICPEFSKIAEKLSIPVFNNSLTSQICNDKAKTHAFFSDKQVPMAKTFFCDRRFFQGELYSFPLILKSNGGHGGTEVFLVENAEDALKKASLLSNDRFILQEIVQKSVDVRVYMLDGKILSCVKRESANSFKSNFSLGGSASLCCPNPCMEKICQVVYQALSPTYVGVDFTFDLHGNPLLNEIEDVVGSRMLYQLTNLKIHQLLLDAVFQHLS